MSKFLHDDKTKILSRKRGITEQKMSIIFNFNKRVSDLDFDTNPPGI